MFHEACVTEEQVICQCIFQDPLTLNISVWLAMAPTASMYLFGTGACTAYMAYSSHHMGSLQSCHLVGCRIDPLQHCLDLCGA